MPEKYIATLLTPSDLQHQWSAPLDSVTRMDNDLLIKSFPVSLVGFQKFFLFWIHCLILEDRVPSIEMAFDSGDYTSKLEVCHTFIQESWVYVLPKPFCLL